MTRYPFKLNGVDFSDVVHCFGYESYRLPVFAAQWEDLSGVSHETLLRTRGVLRIPLNDLEQSRSAVLCRALRQRPLTVTYWNFDYDMEVQEVMRVESVPRRLLLEDGAESWIEGETLNFTQR